MPKEEVEATEDTSCGNPKSGYQEINVHRREQLRTGTTEAEAQTECSFNSDSNKMTAL